MQSGFQNSQRGVGSLAPVEAAPRELTALLGQLDDIITNVENAAERLACRLAPVRMAVPTKGDLAGSKGGATSPFGKALVVNIDRLGVLADRVSELVDELAV